MANLAKLIVTVLRFATAAILVYSAAVILTQDVLAPTDSIADHARWYATCQQGYNGPAYFHVRSPLRENECAQITSESYNRSRTAAHIAWILAAIFITPIGDIIFIVWFLMSGIITCPAAGGAALTISFIVQLVYEKDKFFTILFHVPPIVAACAMLI